MSSQSLWQSYQVMERSIAATTRRRPRGRWQQSVTQASPPLMVRACLRSSQPHSRTLPSRPQLMYLSSGAQWATRSTCSGRGRGCRAGVG
jgi:hypothetical protein